MGETLHRFLAAPTEVRSLRASSANPRSLSAKRRPSMTTRLTNPALDSGATVS